MDRIAQRILRRTHKVRQSRRYPGYLRAANAEYQRALVEILEEDGRDLTESMKLEDTVRDLRERLRDPVSHSVCGKSTKRILSSRSVRNPLQVSAEEFNVAAESFYRGDLRREHLREAIELLEEDIAKLESLGSELGAPDALRFVREARRGLLDGRLPGDHLRRLIQLVLVVECSGASARRCSSGADRRD